MNYPTSAQIARVVKAAQKLGIAVAGFRVGADGEITVFDQTAAPLEDEFDRWDRERRA